MSKSKNPILWENDEFKIITPLNPHLPYSEGVHLVISPKSEIANAWENPSLAGRTFKLAAEVCRVMDSLEIAPWFNLQANGNWGLLPNAKPFFHIHVYGRNKTKNWAKPIVLPEAPGTYNNQPMPNELCSELSDAFTKQLQS